MVAERKMQPMPPPEHRRIFRYAIVLAMFLLAFSCWALVNSRIKESIPKPAVLMADADQTPPTLTAEDHSRTSVDDSTSSPTPTSYDNATTTAMSVVDRISVPVIREPVMVGSGGSERIDVCDADSAALRVYVYDLPAEFHFGMVGWDGKKNAAAWPDVSDAAAVPHYPGGLNLQHSVAYWLTLDILSSTLPRDEQNRDRPCTAVRVTNASLADVFFVPFFASLSYNRHSRLRRGERASRNRVLQAQLVKFLVRREEWRRWGGKDHLIVPHHPNSMMQARKPLSAAMFVLSDFGRYSPDVANLKKDVIAPYKHVVRSIGDEDSPGFDQRPILAYFQGAIHRKDGGKVRAKLYQLLKGEKDVHFTYGNVRQNNGIRRATAGMSSSKFCLNIAGDTPSSNRLFDAIVSHCLPVVVSDDIELPFEDVLDYSEFCVFVRAADAARKGFLLRLLRGMPRDEWTRMWTRLKEVARHFEYQYPSRPGDAVNMIWAAVARKMHSVKLQLHKRSRFIQSTSSE
ncbi:hypothetical protein PR202_ga30037 [Eleusine coracana subsp. coracana]|uniref:Exostosin GT47 domain-containing protein n=1 Tax=Eleusine coracana subsp. coracana TaxID=191504 RepID=A0AAV5DNG5_ELECO|nr:hypothetical protein PR202_ga30037 [Eleusine coracana subsp. coracana]